MKQGIFKRYMTVHGVILAGLLVWLAYQFYLVNVSEAKEAVAQEVYDVCFEDTYPGDKAIDEDGWRPVYSPGTCDKEYAQIETAENTHARRNLDMGPPLILSAVWFGLGLLIATIRWIFFGAKL